MSPPLLRWSPRCERSVVRATSAALDDLANALPAPIESISLRAWPLDFPDDIVVQRRAPYEARVDAIMYRQVLSELAHARGWDVHFYDAKEVVGQAVSMLGARADEVLHGPRATMGPPWAKDHRVARGDDRGRLNRSRSDRSVRRIGELDRVSCQRARVSCQPQVQRMSYRRHPAAIARLAGANRVPDLRHGYVDETRGAGGARRCRSRGGVVCRRVRWRRC